MLHEICPGSWCNLIHESSDCREEECIYDFSVKARRKEITRKTIQMTILFCFVNILSQFKIGPPWDVTLCSVVDIHLHFRGTCCLNLQSLLQKRQVNNCQTSRRHIPENNKLHNHCHVNLRSYFIAISIVTWNFQTLANTIVGVLILKTVWFKLLHNMFILPITGHKINRRAAEINFNENQKKWRLWNVPPLKSCWLRRLLG
jgi:hypothetical protein